MHYSVLVLTQERPESAEDASITEALEPYGDGREWDWWQIGGRWTGLFDGYDPDADPKLMETCDLCRGTGKRTDMVVENGCNGCRGTGRRVSWPTQWPWRREDTIPVAELTAEQLAKFHAMCVEGYGWFGGERYEPWHPEAKDRFVEQDKPPLEWLKEQGGFVTVVDCHN